MKGSVWLLWLAVVVASLFQIQRSAVVTDVSSFLPGPANPTQRLMLNQLRDGVSTRIVLLGLSLDRVPASSKPNSAQTAALIAASRALRDTLATDRAFAWVSNGDLETLVAERERVFGARYLLSPAINPQLFSPAGLRAALDRLEQELTSARGAAVRPIAAADPTLEALQLLERTSRQLAPQGGGGVWLGADGRVALLLMETTARGNDIAAMGATIRSARRSAEEVLKQWPAGEVVPVVEFAGSGWNIVSVA